MFVVTEALTIEAILGLDFLENNGCTLDLRCRSLTLADSTTIPLSSEVKPESTTQLAVSVMSTLRIPPTSEVEVMGHVNGNISEYPHILEQLAHKRLPVRVARALVIPSSLGVPVRLMNPTSETVTIYKNSSIATMEAIDSVEINAPIRQHPRQLPAAYRQETSRLLQDMLKKDTIRPSQSP